MTTYEVHVEMLDTNGEWQDSDFRNFPIVPVAGDFVTFGLNTWEVLKRVVQAGVDRHAASITVKMVG